MLKMLRLPAAGACIVVTRLIMTPCQSGPFLIVVSSSREWFCLYNIALCNAEHSNLDISHCKCILSSFNVEEAISRETEEPLKKKDASIEVGK
jgi:hypothetical protein